MILIFVSITEKKYKLMKMIVSTYYLELISILLNIFLAIEVDEKDHTERDLIFEEKRQKVLEKKLNCKFIRINTSRDNYDADYEASRIQAFISQFKDKEKENEIRKIRRRNKQIKASIDKAKCTK